MAFSPIHASQQITDQYKRYLSTTFQINHPAYQKQFIEQLHNQSMYAAGPYLEVRENFKKAQSIRELVEQGVLPHDFLRLGFPSERPLYAHQRKAIDQILAGKNLVVSTGTGSGKTESFLIPILADLVREHEEGTLGRGVRALLIYPMNALANDQVERLRELLKEFPQIRFGAYTGQTKEKTEEALAEYKRLNHGAVPVGGELISREQMKQNPPHILITNYAMLEYLMVRPGDSVFFDDDTWRYIVLDEAHVYRGSTGIEVSMLLRRLRATLRNADLQYILTSATLGSPDEDHEVASFAQNLCCSPFDEHSVIRAECIAIPTPENQLNLPVEFYRSVAQRIDEGCVDEEINRDILQSNPQWRLDASAALYDAVYRDSRYSRIRKCLETPQTVSALSGMTGLSNEEIELFVAVAAHCERAGVRLFDARYHMFLRATESVFVTLAPSSKLFLTRRESYTEKDGQKYAVFEILTCASCHAVYLTGKIEGGYLKQCANDEGSTVFFLGDAIEDTDEDNQDVLEKTEAYTLCAVCGYLRRKKSRSAYPCGHGEQFQVPVIRIRSGEGSRGIKKCVACEAVNNNGILRSFFSGQEAVTSVIATSLFQTLPQSEVRIRTMQQEDDFGFGISDYTEKQEIQKAKQFLTFSDSRQASAYFATYMDTTYRKLLYKRLLVEQLRGQEVPRTLSAFCEDLQAMLEQKGILAYTDDRAEKESWKAILAEAAETGANTSLYGLGLMAMGIDTQMVRANPKLGLSQEEVASMMNVLTIGLLNDVAVYCPVPMTEDDRAFYMYSSIPCKYRLSGNDSLTNTHGFVPVKERYSNRRQDYLRKVLGISAPNYPPERVREILSSIFSLFIQMKLLRPEGEGYQLNPACLKVLNPQSWYRCSRCGRLTPYNVKRVCPTYRCEGQLNPCNPEMELADHHYYRLYQDLELRPLRIREHTAQLDKDTAYRYQQDFKEKRLDVLSCSTTFEMGVDVGSLETVFMRNMPPMPSNYAQRAGRAGRSKRSAAYALTFCNRSNHDFAYFKNPIAMIKGQIHTPHFNIENEKIAIRHLYASALSFFFKKHPEYFSTVKRFAGQNEDVSDEQDAITLLKAYLASRPEELRRFLQSFLPARLYREFGCDAFDWVERLVGENDETPGKLTTAVAEYRYEVGKLHKAAEEAFRKNASTGYYVQRIRNYERENVLSFLSRRNIMPQYGFPVDTVALQVEDRKAGNHYGVELQRDLAMAISEYAPGSQVVANGRLFTSRYIKKMPSIGWKMYDYVSCESCQSLNIEVSIERQENEQLKACRICGCALKAEAQKTFLVPEFGFEADSANVQKPGLIKPRRTYRGDISYVGYRHEGERKRIPVGRALAEIQYCSKDEMAVMNCSDFYVCEACGYAELGPGFVKSIEKPHKMPSGRACQQRYLRRLSLGYRFETDVFQLHVIDVPLELGQHDQALSVLHAMLRGISLALDIEEQDIDGCLQSFENPVTGAYGYGFVFYDSTPGGAGHVKRLEDEKLLAHALERALDVVASCTCGGDEADASCYGCLRSYRNQRIHDLLKRRLAIQYLSRILR